MQKQKGFSALILIIIVVAVAVVATGGVFSYQYLAKSEALNPKSETNSNVQNPNNQTAQPSITVTSPNGGETWKIGETYNITWTVGIPYDAGCHSSLSLQDNNGNIFGFLTSSMEKGQTSFSWDTTKQLFSGTCMTGATSFNLSPGTYRIKLLSEGGDVPGQPNITAYSNYFSIVAPTSQTAGWKTFTRTYMNSQFEIKYPDGYAISEPDGKYTDIIFHKDKRTFDILMTENCGSASGVDTSIVNINGVNFTKYYESRNYSAQVSTSAYKYCAVRGNWAYNLILRIESANSFEADTDPVLNQILYTFKFTK